MRLWHYKLIPFLPKSQLLAQWRELNSIFANHPNHILIDYVYDYPNILNLEVYASFVLNEMRLRGYRIFDKSLRNFKSYIGTMPTHFADTETELRATIDRGEPIAPFQNHHDFFYLRQCYYNLEEKFMRGQKDFDGETMRDLATFYEAEYAKFKGERK